jgi:hypothetical protein
MGNVVYCCKTKLENYISNEMKVRINGQKVYRIRSQELRRTYLYR